jgi:ribosomal protein L27
MRREDIFSAAGFGPDQQAAAPIIVRRPGTKCHTGAAQQNGSAVFSESKSTVTLTAMISSSRSLV